MFIVSKETIVTNVRVKSGKDGLFNKALYEYYSDKVKTFDCERSALEYLRLNGFAAFCPRGYKKGLQKAFTSPIMKTTVEAQTIETSVWEDGHKTTRIIGRKPAEQFAEFWIIGFDEDYAASSLNLPLWRGAEGGK